MEGFENTMPTFQDDRAGWNRNGSWQTRELALSVGIAVALLGYHPKGKEKDGVNYSL